MGVDFKGWNVFLNLTCSLSSWWLHFVTFISLSSCCKRSYIRQLLYVTGKSADQFYSTEVHRGAISIPVKD